MSNTSDVHSLLNKSIFQSRLHFLKGQVFAERKMFLKLRSVCPPVAVTPVSQRPVIVSNFTDLQMDSQWSM